MKWVAFSATPLLLGLAGCIGMVEAVHDLLKEEDRYAEVQ